MKNYEKYGFKRESAQKPNKDSTLLKLLRSLHLKFLIQVLHAVFRLCMPMNLRILSVQYLQKFVIREEKKRGEGIFNFRTLNRLVFIN